MVVYNQTIVEEQAVVDQITLQPEHKISRLMMQCVDGKMEHSAYSIDVDLFGSDIGWGTLNLFIDGDQYTLQAYVEPNGYMASYNVDMWVGGDMTAHRVNEKASNEALIDLLSKAEEQIAWELDYDGVTSPLHVVPVTKFDAEIIDNFKTNCGI